MRRALRHLIERVARTGLLLVFAMGSPSIGGAFRCCSSGEHGGGAAHQMSRPGGTAVSTTDTRVDSPTAGSLGHAHAAHATPAQDASEGAPDAGGEESSSLPCDCVGECCAPPALAHAAPTIRLGATLRPESSAPVVARGDRRPHDRLGFLLPFANGPPHRLTV